MSVTVYVPRDSGALAVGAEAVAEAIAAEAQRRGEAVALVRNGSRGLYWLEPMVEVATDTGRIAYGPVSAADVPGLFDAGLLAGGEHPLRQGPTEEIPYLKAQQRLTFRRVGLNDPLSLEAYQSLDGFKGLRRALAMAPEAIVEEVTTAGLRGRGGAAFPTGIKWKTVAQAQGAPKYIVCNADEGDSGTFSDRMVMEGDPYLLIEGMAIAGLAVGAEYGYIYLRSEYPHAERVLRQAIERAEAAGLLGADILGSGHSFFLELRRGAGAYICGEETSLLESLEGKRGQVRFKPPLPALEGLFGQPTVVNNVISLASVPVILERGGEYYRDFGMGRSRGTLPIQLTGNIRRGGLVELAFGVSLEELIFDYGGGTATGRPVKAVQVGGPLGAYLPAHKLATPTDYEALMQLEGTLGHGGIVVFDDSVDMALMARHAMAFCAFESCGKCTPCRIGSTRGTELLDRIIAERDHGGDPARIELLRELCDTLLHGSLCALGGMTPFPVLSALNDFPEDFGIVPQPAAAEA